MVLVGGCSGVDAEPVVICPVWPGVGPEPASLAVVALQGPASAIPAFKAIAMHPITMKGVLRILSSCRYSSHQQDVSRRVPTAPFTVYVGGEQSALVELESGRVAVPEYPMAPRANWKGYLRLSLVSCPVALYPATSDAEKITFNQINRKTGHRIKYLKVDAETGDEVDADDIMKGYKVDTDTYIEIGKDDLEGIALESTRTIDIDEFVPKSEIDPRYLIRPYYLTPDGKVGHDAYAVIRETIRSMNMVAIGRLVLTNREHIIALEPLDKGLMGTLLRYPYEVRDQGEYFDDIRDVKITKDMLDLAKHIVQQKTADFEPGKFEDRYETALTELINQKRNGRTIAAKPRPRGDNVVDLMDALKRSLAGERKGAAPPKAAKGKRRKTAPGQKEMLLPIAGSGSAAKDQAKKPGKSTGRQRKAG